MRFLWHIKKVSHKITYRILCLLIVACLASTLGLRTTVTALSSQGSTSGTWTSPSDINIIRTGDSDPVQHDLGLFSNLDCSLLTYRTVTSATMQTGCFTATAFGLFDGSMAIFNGTDEALPIIPYSANEILAPWPQAASLLAFDSSVSGGWYVSLYKGVSPLQDQRDNFGRLVAKKLSAPPTIQLRDPSGRLLAVNPQTIAFSQNGSWMVAETTFGYFVRINLSSLQMTPFAASFNSQGSSSPQDAQVAVSDNGQYVAVANGKENALRVYDVATCNISTWNTNVCQPYEYWSSVAHKLGRLTTVKHVRFQNDDLLSFESTSTDPAGSSRYELSPDGKIVSLAEYLGLGDSYTSGEGGFDYIEGTDTPTNKCHLSVHSYPLLLASDLFGPDGGHSVACSGAVISDIDNTSSGYSGQTKNGLSLGELENDQPSFLRTIVASYTPGYIPQDLFIKKYQPKVMTVSIGGNDIGFGDILQTCVEPHIELHPRDNTCYNTYESRQEVLQLIDRQIPRWIVLYKQLRELSPRTKIYALGYPDIIAPTGNCGLNVHLNKEEARFAGELVNYLDSDIYQAAKQAGVPYIDISGALLGHRLCESTSANIAVNGLTSGKDSGVFGVNVLGRESYHPNALGQALIEQSILSKMGGLPPPQPSLPNVVSSAQILSSAPKQGRVVNDITFDDKITSGLVARAALTHINVSGSDDGLSSNGAYAVRLDGPEGNVLTILGSSDNKNFSANFIIPSSVVSGNHTIDITGTDQAGKPMDIIQPIYVPSSFEDFDGDGIYNDNDPCPYSASTSGSDHESIDDSCDSSMQPKNSSQASKSGPGFSDMSQVEKSQNRSHALLRPAYFEGHRSRSNNANFTKQSSRAVLSSHIKKLKHRHYLHHNPLSMKWYPLFIFQIFRHLCLQEFFLIL